MHSREAEEKQEGEDTLTKIDYVLWLLTSWAQMGFPQATSKAGIHAKMSIFMEIWGNN